MPLPSKRHCQLLPLLLVLPFLLPDLVAGCSSDTTSAPPEHTAPGADGGPAEGEGEESKPCLDQDGDRYGAGMGCLGADCRDDDPFAHPEAAERCNGLDDDCDGIPDSCQCAPWLGTSGCPAGQHCAAEGEDSVARCVPVSPHEPVEDGEPCSSAPCRPGSQCVRWSEGAKCTHTCDPYSGDGCRAPEECLSHLSGNPKIGLCRVPPPLCDIYNAAACPAGEACRPFFHPGGGGADLRCQSAGARGAGDRCGGDEGQCLPGLICVLHGANEQRSCYRVCQEDTACLDGGGCRGRTGTLGIRYCI